MPLPPARAPPGRFQTFGRTTRRVEYPYHPPLGRGFRAPAFSCTATGEERYFCCPFDRCGLAPASRTVSPRSGKDLSSLLGPSRVLSLAGPLHHQSHRVSGLRFAVVLCTLGPQPLILYIRNIKPDDMNIPLLAHLAQPGWGYAP